MIPTFAFDYETYYSKDYTIKDLGTDLYVRHPEFDPYLLAVYGDDSFEWCGHPKDFDWERFQGANIIALNAPFEEAVTERLKELTIIPAGIEFAALFDVADLAAYLGYPRSLKEAAFHLLGVKVDKGMRDKAKGKRWADMLPSFQQQMIEYAMTDARLEYRMFKEHAHKWPQWERDVSQLTRSMCKGGVPIDTPQVEEAVNNLTTELWKIRTQIPWASDPDAPALSPKLVAAECRKSNIPPPKSMAKDSELFDEWLRKYGDEAPWAKAVGQYRRVNALLKKMQTMKDRTRNNVMIYGLKYGGAHTMRDSGDTGFNVQNLPRQPFFFNSTGMITDDNRVQALTKKWKKKEPLDDIHFMVDMRGCIKAPEGKVLGVCDLRAIEPCVLATLSGDTELVELLKQGYDVYEAQARATNRYSGEEPLKDVDPHLRSLMKVEVLGLGYGAGPDKLKVIAKDLAGIELTLEKAASIVFNFRKREFIPDFWKMLEEGMRSSAPDDFEMELPSGRTMRYRKVQSYHGLTALIPRIGKMMRVGFWGGSLTENITQAAARDVFMDRVLALRDEGLPPILRVHDEAVALLDEDTAEDDLKLMNQVMGTAPKWWPELPVSAEGHLCKNYIK